MKTGDIVFVRGLFNKGEFSHVALAVSDTHVVEVGWSSRVRISPMKYPSYTIIRLPMSERQRRAIVDSAIRHCGTRYGIRWMKHRTQPVTSVLMDVGEWYDQQLVSPVGLWRELSNRGSIVI